MNEIAKDPARLSAARFAVGVATIAAVVAFWMLIAPAAAHQFLFTEARASFESDRTFHVDVTSHLDAMLLGLPSGSLIASDYDYLHGLSTEEIDKRLERLRDHFSRTIRLRFDGEIFSADIDFPPDPPELMEAAIEDPFVDMALLNSTVRFSGTAPAEAAEFTFTASRLYGPVNLTLTWEGAEEPIRHALRTAHESPPFPLDRIPIPLTRLQIGWQYLGVGYIHIVPAGLDHILFVLGLFLLSIQIRPLLWQVTAFTLAHTLTLALSIYQVISLPSSIVEPLIALSIAYVAVENIFTSELKPWRPAVVFGFGLLHGLGFAGVLADWGLPRSEFVTALVTFNVGVEIGQLTVIAAAFLLVGWFRKREWYRKRIVIPCSLAIAMMGVYWAVERTLGA